LILDMIMKNENLVFHILPLFIILLLLTSNVEIMPIFIGSPFEFFLYKISIPNPILFNLSISYISGVFVYFLTGYLPFKKIKNINQEIETKLIKQLQGKLSTIQSSLLNLSTVKYEKDHDFTLNDFKELCKNTDFNVIDNVVTISSYNPFETRHLLFREHVYNLWFEIIKTITEIENVSSIIKPETILLIMSIKKSMLSQTIEMFKNIPVQNTNFESWHTEFFRLNEFNKELDSLISKGMNR
jgi:hypothetical protein